MLTSIEPLYQNQSGAVVKQLLLVIYADFRRTTIAEIDKIMTKFQRPQIVLDRAWAKTVSCIISSQST